jgi:hypothetical protein
LTGSVHRAQDGHQHDINPRTINTRRLAQHTFSAEPDATVKPLRPLVRGKDVQIDPMKGELFETKREQETDCLRADAAAARVGGPDPDREFRAPVHWVDCVQLARPHETVAVAKPDAEDAHVGAHCNRVEPLLVRFSRHGLERRAQRHELAVIDPVE